MTNMRLNPIGCLLLLILVGPTLSHAEPAEVGKLSETAEIAPPAPAPVSADEAIVEAVPTSKPEPVQCPTCVPQDLFDALVDLVNPDPTTRLGAIGRLKLMDQPQASPALCYALLNDSEWTVRSAAAEALGAKRGAQVVESLGTALARKGERTDIRITVAKMLGTQDTQAAFGHLWRNRGPADAPLGRAIRGVLKKQYSDQYKLSLKKDPRPPASGLPILIPFMALHGGLFIGNFSSLVGDSAPEDAGMTFLGGAVLGGITPYLVTRKSGISKGRAAWLSATTTWGAILPPATMLGLKVENEKALQGALLGGQVVGLGVGLLTMDRIDYTSGDMLFINMSGFAGMLTAGSILVTTKLEDRLKEASALVVETGFIAGALAAALKTTSLQFSSGDAMAITALTFAGGVAGNLTPYAIGGHQVSDRYTAGGVMLGTALGFAAGTWASQYTDPTPGDVMGMVFGASWGMAIGSGLSLTTQLEDNFSHYTSSFILIGGALGAYGASRGIDTQKFNSGSRIAVLAGMGWGIWQGGGIGSLASDDDGVQAGATLLGYGLGGVTALTLATLRPPTKAEVGAVATAGFWGGWLGGFGSYLGKKHGGNTDDDDMLLATLAASDAGLALGILALSPIGGKMHAHQLGYISLAGALGMGIGTSIGAISSDYVAEGNVIGTSLGLIGGYFWTQGMDFTKKSGQSKSKASLSSELNLWPTFAAIPEPGGGTRLQVGLMGFN